MGGKSDVDQSTNACEVSGGKVGQPSMNATPIVMTSARTMCFNMVNTVVPPHRRFFYMGAMTGRVSPRRRLSKGEEVGPMDIQKQMWLEWH